MCRTRRLGRFGASVAAILMLASSSLLAQSALAAAVKFDIESQPLPRALNTWAEQAGMQVIWPAGDIVAYLNSPPVRGQLEPMEALRALLEDTGLTYSLIEGGRTVAIHARERSSGLRSAAYAGIGGAGIAMAATGSVAAPLDAERSGDKQVASTKVQGPVSEDSRGEFGIRGIPEVLVIGSRILNTDIKRTRDDVQPYVTFDQDTIERSGASSVGDFLKDRLSMNSISTQSSQVPFSASGNMSSVSLRGLGANQTLILIDGRRVASPSAGGNSLGQADLNSIPIGAIERIEVLPTTASGIYGGAATGGVINVVLRRDYEGLEVQATYGSNFDGAGPMHRVDAAIGFNFPNDRTNILVAGSYSEQEVLAVEERDLVQRGRSLISRNNPSFFATSTNPPLGATPNIRSANGTPLFGPGTPNHTSVPAGYVAGSGIDPLQSNAGIYNLSLADSAQFPGGAEGALLNGPRTTVGTATARHELTENISTFLDFFAANNVGRSYVAAATGVHPVPATAPTNPFGQNIVVTVPVPQAGDTLLADDRTRRVTGGVIVGLPRTWSAEVDYTWSETSSYSSSPSSLSTAAQAAINAGTLDIIRDTQIDPIDFSPYLNAPNRAGPFRNTFHDAMLRIGGPVGQLWGGPVSVSTLVEHQRQSLDDGYQLTPSAGTTLLFPSRGQKVTSVSLETLWPLVSPRNAVLGMNAFEVQLAGRFDDYSIDGATGFVANPTPNSTIVRRKADLSSVNSTVGLRYEVVPSVVLRASYGTGFLPPAVNQLAQNASVGAGISVIDPQRGGAATLVPGSQLTTGGNPNLDPEESESWSAGIILKPSFVPGLRLAADVTRIHKTDEIRTLSAQQIVDNENILEGRVTRGPVAPNDPYGVGPIVALNATLVNLARSRVEAYDFGFDYQIDTTAVGTWTLSSMATLQKEHKTKLLPSSPFVENVGVTSTFPLKLRANAQLTWSSRGWTVGWMARYFDSYWVANPSASGSSTIIRNQGSARVPSQAYHDVVVAYQFPKADSDSASFLNPLSDLEVRVGARNVFDEDPPFDAGNTFFLYSPFGDPRGASFFVSMRKTF